MSDILFDIDSLIEEINFLSKQLKLIIPDLYERPLSAENLGWLPIKPGSYITVRDWVLFNSVCDNRETQDIQGELNTVSTCPIFFSVDSSGHNFHVDHFFPEDIIMEKLDSLVANQQLLSVDFFFKGLYGLIYKSREKFIGLFTRCLSNSFF